jgi:hypothetical protein
LDRHGFHKKEFKKFGRELSAQLGHLFWIQAAPCSRFVKLRAKAKDKASVSNSRLRLGSGSSLASSAMRLVGIAGEDDLDAPDLGAVPNPEPELARELRNPSNGQGAATRRTAPGRGKLPRVAARSVLGSTAIDKPSGEPDRANASYKFGGRGRCLGASESVCREHADSGRCQNCNQDLTPEAPYKFSVTGLPIPDVCFHGEFWRLTEPPSGIRIPALMHRRSEREAARSKSR